MKTMSILLLTILVSSAVIAQETRGAFPVENSEAVIEVAKKQGFTKKDEHPTALQQECPSLLDAGNIYDPSRYTVNLGFAAGDIAAMVYVVPFSGFIKVVHWKPNSNSFSDTNATLGIFRFRLDSTGSPIGDALWGPFPIPWPNSSATQHIYMMDFGYEPEVNAVDTIVIAIRKTPFDSSGTSSLAIMRGSDPGIPFRFYKYYYFGRGGSGPGWWVREFDMFIWFSVGLSGDVPPTITSMTRLHHTLDTGPQSVCFSAFDCNPGNPADTGIAAARLVYRVNNGPWDTLSFSQTDSGWCTQVPGQPLGSTVNYFFIVTDIHGNSNNTSTASYRVVDLNRANYVYSTPPFSFTNIAGDAGATELPGTVFQGTGADDDGTAGPIPIGGNFNFFGRDTMQYVWVSANGGIGMTGTATDTVWVNSTRTRTGTFTNFAIPGTAPRNFIAGLWNDLYLAPSGHGSVWHKQVGTQLIIQYNRVGNFNDAGDTTTTFQIVLDRADSSMTFNYLDVGVTGLELQGLVAAQASSTDLWTFINGSGYPVESRPANNKSIKLKERILTGVEDRGGELPSKFALYPNYPNPFNPTTVIRYELPKQVMVSLKVYNLLGQEVASLVNEVQSAGKYQVGFRGESLSSGVYFYRLFARPISGGQAGAPSKAQGSGLWM
jgi:hypothetical protein